MRLHNGDRVILIRVPGHWRVMPFTAREVTLTGIDSFAKTLASLSPCGTVTVIRTEVHPTTIEQETLL